MTVSEIIIIINEINKLFKIALILEWPRSNMNPIKATPTKEIIITENLRKARK